MSDGRTLPLFGAVDTPADGAGALSCGVEIALAMSEALERARSRGLSRADVVARMSRALGRPVSEAMLDAYCSPAHDKHEVSLSRAIAFGAAIGEDVLLKLHARKLGRTVVTPAESALIELGRIQQEERDLAARKKAVQALLKLRGET